MTSVGRERWEGDERWRKWTSQTIGKTGSTDRGEKNNKFMIMGGAKFEINVERENLLQNIGKMTNKSWERCKSL